MNLIFRLSMNDPLEIILATSRYKKYWDTHKDEIFGSFEKHTGLTFQQGQITVRVSNQDRSYSGDRHKPMTLSCHYVSEGHMEGALLHELAHRLLGGNDINPPDKNELYIAHCYTSLFLYDIWAELLGKTAADTLLEWERSSKHSSYKKAWSWALSMSYEQRQRTLRKLVESRGKVLRKS